MTRKSIESCWCRLGVCFSNLGSSSFFPGEHCFKASFLGQAFNSFSKVPVKICCYAATHYWRLLHLKVEYECKKKRRT